MTTDVKEACCNPKQIQREGQKQVQNAEFWTSSKHSLKLQPEQLKVERKVVSREQREAENRGSLK